jgi:threonyl-tRNA synthetase
MVVVGPREAEAGAVALRDRIDGDQGAMPLDAAMARLRAEVDNKTIRQVAASKFAAVDEGGGEANEY